MLTWQFQREVDVLILPRGVVLAFRARHVALTLTVEDLINYRSFNHGASPTRAIIAFAAGCRCCRVAT